MAQKTEVLKVRLTPALYRLIKKAAKRYGHDLSAWVRWHLGRAAREELGETEETK